MLLWASLAVHFIFCTSEPESPRSMHRDRANQNPGTLPSSLADRTVWRLNHPSKMHIQGRCRALLHHSAATAAESLFGSVWLHVGSSHCCAIPITCHVEHAEPLSQQIH